MAKIREIYVEVKKSLNFQTYTVGNFIIIEEGDDEDLITAQYKAKCRKHVMQEFEIDRAKR